MKLYTAATPNGWKTTIMLEELVEAGDLTEEFEVHQVDLMAGEQFSPEFIRINPNQKIPALVDGELLLMESCAILQYLAEKHSSKLLPLGPSRWQVLQWLFWQAANLGPVFGNKLSYTRYLTDIPDAQKQHPLERFGLEARRLTKILERQLEQGDYVCGSEYSIADISLYPWLRGWKWSKVDITDCPRINEWLKRIRSRPAVERGLLYGTTDKEVDQWGEQKKKEYAAAGQKIASNASLDPSGNT